MDNTTVQPTSDIEISSTSHIPSKLERKWEKIVIPHETREGTVLQIKETIERFLNALLVTEGNMTEAGLMTFDTTDRVNANRMAHRYFKKAQEIGRIYSDSNGLTWGKFIATLTHKIETTDNPEFLKMAMKITGFGDYLEKDNRSISSTINIIKVENDKTRRKFGFNTDEDVEEGEIMEEQDAN